MKTIWKPNEWRQSIRNGCCNPTSTASEKMRGGCRRWGGGEGRGVRRRKQKKNMMNMSRQKSAKTNIQSRSGWRQFEMWIKFNWRPAGALLTARRKDFAPVNCSALPKWLLSLLLLAMNGIISADNWNWRANPLTPPPPANEWITISNYSRLIQMEVF